MSKNLTWTEVAWSDYLYWQQQDRKTLKRINALIKDILRNPYEGIGKPEALKWDFAGAWSRRISEKHRIIYVPTDDGVTIISCQEHYREH